MWFEKVEGWRVGVAIRRESWPKKVFIQFFKGLWRDHEQRVYEFGFYDWKANDWEKYDE